MLCYVYMYNVYIIILLYYTILSFLLLLYATHPYQWYRAVYNSEGAKDIYTLRKNIIITFGLLTCCMFSANADIVVFFLSLVRSHNVEHTHFRYAYYIMVWCSGILHPILWIIYICFDGHTHSFFSVNGWHYVGWAQTKGKSLSFTCCASWILLLLHTFTSHICDIALYTAYNNE